MKLKDALVKAGKIDESQRGRGRPSAQMIEWAKELVADGWDIDGFTPTKAKESDKPVEVKHKPTTNAGQEIADIGDPIHPLETWEAIVSHNGTLVPIPTGPKAVCNNCSCSLPWCPCPSPVVNLDHQTTGVVVWRIKSR
jgi:hypothetical protein